MNLKIVIFISVLSLSLQSCQYLHESVVPVKTIHKSYSATRDTLLILIPGIADNESTFIKEGFLEALEHGNAAVDVVAAHVHLGYLLNDTFIERIEHDLIRPARSQGYKKIWFVGVSLGAFVALNYMKERPADVTGVLALGPFMGEDNEINVIRQAGGIGAWRPNNIVLESRTLRLWHWYQQQARQGSLQNIYLGYGADDHLLSGINQLRQLLPEQNVRIVSGGHKWTSWLALWKEFLELKIFSR